MDRGSYERLRDAPGRAERQSRVKCNSACAAHIKGVTITADNGSIGQDPVAVYDIMRETANQ